MSKRLKNYTDSAYILIPWGNTYAVFDTYANVDRWLAVADAVFQTVPFHKVARKRDRCVLHGEGRASARPRKKRGRHDQWTAATLLPPPLPHGRPGTDARPQRCTRCSGLQGAGSGKGVDCQSKCAQLAGFWDSSDISFCQSDNEFYRKWVTRRMGGAELGGGRVERATKMRAGGHRGFSDLVDAPGEGQCSRTGDGYGKKRFGWTGGSWRL